MAIFWGLYHFFTELTEVRANHQPLCVITSLKRFQQPSDGLRNRDWPERKEKFNHRCTRMKTDMILKNVLLYYKPGKTEMECTFYVLRVVLRSNTRGVADPPCETW